MTRFTKDSKYRLRNFKTRASYSPGDVLVNPIEAQDYIPIHPFGDDNDLIKKIGLEASDCKAVDAYWHMGTDISFLQVGTRDIYSSFEPGYYAQWSKKKKEYLILTCVTQSDFITRSEFEGIMSRFSKMGCLPSETLRKKLRVSQRLD